MPTTTTTNRAPLTGAPACPTCGGRMWDNRASKRNPKAPDFKCRNPQCGGRIWPGQHRAAIPIIRPAALPQWGAGAPANRSSTTEGRGEESGGTTDAPAAAALRRCYLGVTDFVLAEVRPRYDVARVPCGDATVAAIVATLFIATCKGDGV